MATDYLADVKKYDAGASADAVTKIVKHLGIALRNRDSSLVSCSGVSFMLPHADTVMPAKAGIQG